MDMRHLPGLDREVSAIGAGCWTIGGAATNRGVPIGWTGVDQGHAFEGLVRAFELGVTLFDTADVYGMGHSERLVGQLLEQVDRRTVVVSSKVGYFAGTAAHPYQRRQILRQFETTTENLGTGYLDLYFLHSGDFGPGDQYLDEAVETVRGLRTAGLVHAVGMRAPNEFAAQWAVEPDAHQGPKAARFLDLFERIRPDVLTVRHNLLSPLYRPEETDVFAFARRHGVGVLLKQVLGQGLLVNAHHPASPPVFPSEDHRHADPRFSGTALRTLHHALGVLAAHFGEDRRGLLRLALQYALQADADAIALLGFRDAEQITGSISALGRPLTPLDLGEIQRLMQPVRDMLAQTPYRTPER